MRPCIGVDNILVKDVARSLTLSVTVTWREPTRRGADGGPTYGPSGRAAYFAGRFAAKEAVYKAIRFPRSQTMAWTDIEVRRSSLGWPEVSFHRGVRAWANEVGIDLVEVSIS
jgi:holo-[acyl-carrier protein] synthase